MLDALSVTTWSDIRILEPVWLGTLELTTLLGMAGALLWIALRPVPEGTLARLVVWGYGVLLLSLDGWIALFMLLITPLQFPLDGEFLDEGAPRSTAIGIWFVLCLRACWQLRPRLEHESSPHRAVRALPPDPLRYKTRVREASRNASVARIGASTFPMDPCGKAKPRNGPEVPRRRGGIARNPAPSASSQSSPPTLSHPQPAARSRPRPARRVTPAV